MLEYSIFLVDMAPPSILAIHVKSTFEAFWKNGSFSECVLWELSDAFVDTKLEVLHRRVGR